MMLPTGFEVINKRNSRGIDSYAVLLKYRWFPFRILYSHNADLHFFSQLFSNGWTSWKGYSVEGVRDDMRNTFNTVEKNQQRTFTF